MKLSSVGLCLSVYLFHSSSTRRFAVALALSALFAIFGPISGAQSAAASMAQTGPLAPEVRSEVAHDTSPPLTSLPIFPPTVEGAAPENKPIPEAKQQALARAAAEEQTAGATVAPDLAALEPTAGPMPDTIQNFPGMDNPNGYYPPDTNGDVGPYHYVEMVNVSFAVYDKQGTLLYGPVNNNTIWGGFGGQCQNNNNGDPIVQYDGLADRWVISQFAIEGEEYFECVAVSATPDPLGSYHRYAFNYGNQFPDYPKLGVWPDGYYVTYNMYEDRHGFTGATTCALERRKMLAGAPATQQCYTNPEAFSLLPSDVDGPTPPPPGSPNYVLGEGSTSNDTLSMYRFAVNWDNPASSTFTGPIDIPVASFTPACSEVQRGRCVPQLDSPTKLEALGVRLMYRLAYRNFGTHESLVAVHSVAMDDNPGFTSQIGQRWYEIRSPGAAQPVVYQSGTSASPTPEEFRWMGSIAMDRDGNIALGYSSSSATMHPSINYVGRLATDPLGTMPYEQGTIMDGTGSQLGARWGDYTAMQVDPLDDCTFWYTNEYLKTTSLADWSTQIASFRYPSCQGGTTTPGAPVDVRATAGSGEVALGWSAPASDGGLPITGYTVTASPGGAQCSTRVGVDTNPLACMITGLTNGSSYTFEVTATNALGQGPGTQTAVVSPGAALVPLTPVRIADTRVGQPVAFPADKQPQAGGTTLQVPVAGNFGVPADAAAVSLNVTVVGPSVSGYVTVYPCGTDKPLTSNVNFVANQVVPNAVLSGVGTDGKVCIFTSATTNLVVDLNGWLPQGAGFSTTGPTRVADTRPPSQQPTIPAGGTLEVPVAGRFGVPAGAAALSLNVTAVDPGAAGFLTVFPCGQARPNASSLNYAAGQTVPNAVISKVGTAGAICVFSQQTTNVIVDLNGWFAQPPSFNSLTPTRVADTRVGEPVAFPLPKQTLTAGQTLEIPVTGQFGIPSDAGAVSLNVTAVDPSAAGFLTVFPCGVARPNSSNVNYVAGQTVPNAVFIAIGTGGKVCVFTSQATNLVVDAGGWFPRNSI